MRVWQTIRAPLISRHVHKRAYAALVLSGCYEEAGDSGRHRTQPGNVLLHEAFEAHLDRISTLGAAVLNVPLPAQYAFRSGIGRVEDPDAIVRLVEKGDLQTAALLLLSTEIPEPEFRDWPDELAASLAQNASINLSGWSEAKGFLRGICRAVLRRCSEFHHALFEHVLGRARLGGQFARLVCLCRR
jgi:hypothetical protein